MVLYVLLCWFLLWTPVYVLQTSHPSVNLLMLGGVVITVLKIISFAHTMRNIKSIINVIKKLDGKKVPISDFFNETDISGKVEFLLMHRILRLYKRTLKNLTNWLISNILSTLCWSQLTAFS